MLNLPNWTSYDLKQLYTKSVETVSIDRQALHLSEEMSECMIEVSKLIRGRSTDTSHLAEEIADVMIMLDEMRVLFEIPEADITKLMRIKLEKFFMRVDNNNVSPVALPMHAYDLFSRLRYMPFPVSDDIDMDLRELICKSFFDMTKLEEVLCFVDRFVTFNVSFGLCYQVLTMIQTTCINTDSMTLADYGMVPKIASDNTLCTAINKLIDHAKKANKYFEGMGAKAEARYLKPFVDYVAQKHAKDNQCQEHE